MQKIDKLSLFSKFKGIETYPAISNLLDSVPSGYYETIAKLSSNNIRKVEPSILDNRTKLQSSVKEFHLMANTMTDKVSNNIKLLSDNPYTQIFVSTHQPNLFPYGGVFRKIVLSHTLKKELDLKYRHKGGEHNYEQNSSNSSCRSKIDNEKRIVDLFIIIDHDFLDEIWIRRAQLPSLHHSHGIMSLKFPINKSNRWQMICNAPLPQRNVIDYWKGQIYSWINKNIQAISNGKQHSEHLQHHHSPYKKIDKSNLLKNFDEFWKEAVETSYSKASNYSDFNSILISQIVNRIWNYDTLFTKLTSLNYAFVDGFKYLINNFNKYSESLRNAENIFRDISLQKSSNSSAGGDSRNGENGNKISVSGIRPNLYKYSPFWIHCNCGGKGASVLQYSKDRDVVKLSGSCISCNSNLKLDVRLKDKEISIEIEGKEKEDCFTKISPRAIPILLLLSKSLDITCYISGTGGFNYMLYASLAFEKLNIKMPINIFWPSKDICYGLGQVGVLRGTGKEKHSDVNYHINLLEKKESEYKNMIIPLIDERKNKVKTGQPIKELLSELFILKQEQRHIRQDIKTGLKAKRALNVMPCIIDYAINFGIGNIEIYWRKNLLKNDNFEIPLVIPIEEH